MNIFVLFLLCVVQGLTEFLPISSSGHLVVLYNFFGVENNVKLLSILLHIATLLSVLIYYRKELLILIKKPFCPTNRKIVVTTIFTAAVVLVIKPFIDQSFTGEWLFAFFLVTAMLLFISDYMADKNELLSRTINFKTENVKVVNNIDISNMPITYRQAILIGITQGVACFPGISRSGSTIAVSRICGVRDSARYSFLISIPIIIASFSMEIMEGNISSIDINVIWLIVAITVCMLVGLLCIKVMTKLVAKNRLIYFAYYLIVLAIILMVVGL